MQALVREVLAAWREAERVASQAPQGSDDREAAMMAVERLRAIYVDLTHRGGGPPPPDQSKTRA